MEFQTAFYIYIKDYDEMHLYSLLVVVFVSHIQHWYCQHLIISI